jgi:hypothetical protein
MLATRAYTLIYTNTFIFEDMRARSEKCGERVHETGVSKQELNNCDTSHKHRMAPSLLLGNHLKDTNDVLEVFRLLFVPTQTMYLDPMRQINNTVTSTGRNRRPTVHLLARTPIHGTSS